MTRFAILLGLIVSITSLDANAKCRWRVKGRLVTTNNQPMANKKVKIRARYNKPRGLWNDGNWYDTKTDAQGNFKSHSKPFLLDCRFRRDVSLELRVNKKNVEIARKNRARKGTINFGTVRVNESALVTKAGCRRVTIDARVTIAGKNAAQGIRIRFRHSKISGNHLRTWNFSTPLETRVDALKSLGVLAKGQPAQGERFIAEICLCLGDANKVLRDTAVETLEEGVSRGDQVAIGKLCKLMVNPSPASRLA